MPEADPKGDCPRGAVMKKLILFPVLVISQVGFAQEIFTKEDSNSIVSSIKDIEIGEMLKNTSQFKTCRDKFVFEASDTDAKRTDKIQKAQICFQDQLNKSNRDPKALEKLSESLNLQQYGLVKSKNSKDIQAYLNNKMYKAMTGIDPDKPTVESLKFHKKKHIDQGVFIKLYKNQLNKNSLFEVSRFCFENFRLADKTNVSANFGDYWKAYLVDPETQITRGIVTDDGIPSFSNFKAPEDKDKIYDEIYSGINVQEVKPEKLGKFFEVCGGMIKDLCQDFTESSKITASLDNNVKSEIDSKGSKGAAACLAKQRLLEYKKAITNTDKLEKYFNEQLSATQTDDKLISAMIKGDVKLFGQAGDASFDDLTNYTSKDFVEGNLSQQEADKCSGRPEEAGCENYVGNEENLDKTKAKIEFELTLKRDVEKARVQELVKKQDASLSDYLKENGFFGILEKLEKNELKKENVANEVAKEFEARKKATLEEITGTMGKRQIAKDAKPEEKEAKIKEVANQTKSERARMAQVVMFNNIITSQLSLTRIDEKGNKKSAGRNVNAWKKEEEALKSTSVDQNLFTNLKVTGDANPEGIGQNDSIGGASFIDGLLGKKKEN